MSRRLGLPPMPHQQHIFDVAYEIDPDTGEYWYDEANVFVMRQVGKTMGISLPGMVHRCTMVPHHLGRQRCSFTMQRRDKARKKLEDDFIPQLEGSPHFHRITNPKGRPGRSTKQWKSSLNNGSEHLMFGRGNRIWLGTPVADAGHGDTIDRGDFDEIRFATDDAVEAGYVPSMSTRASHQFWKYSTPGDEKSVYMWPLVVAGRKAVEEDRESRVAYFEYSIPDDADVENPATWWDFHPAVGRTQPMKFFMGELDKALRSPDETKIDTFRQEYAGQWIRTPLLGDGDRPLVIRWEIWEDRHQTRGPFAGPVAVGVDVSPDGESASIVVAGRNGAGKIQVKVIDLQAGTFWLESRLKEVIGDHPTVAVAYDSGGPADAVAGAIARAAGTVPIVRLSGRNYSSACEGFVTGINEDVYCHSDQAWLDSALVGATKKQRGEGWLWDRQTALSDITPIVGATVAVRALETYQPDEEDESVFVSIVLGGDPK
ncbi:MAG: hypothetical protein AAGA42_14355 [Actinomycetota bacterium]